MNGYPWRLHPIAWSLLALSLSGSGDLRSQELPEGTGQTDPEVTVELRGRQRSRFRLAMPATAGATGLTAEIAQAATVVESTLRADLEQSGVFDVQGPVQLSVLALTGDQRRDFELYRSLRNELLLETVVKDELGKLVLEGRVFDLQSGEQVIGKRYRGVTAAARRIAHTFADELVLFFSGRPGISLSSIAFYSDRDGYKEIYLMDFDGENQRPITGHKSISMSPAWSPTGQELAYVSYFSGSPGIYLADLATGRKSPVITSGTLNISPSFSPDGRQLAFARSVGAGNIELFVCNRDGSGLRQLTHSSGIDTNPSWSPTGRRLAFTSSRTGSPQIYVVDVEGANLRRVTFDGDYNEGASWSPDGTRLVYASRRRGSFDIAVADVVTLESRVLTDWEGSHESPCYSPDGRKIVFSSKRPRGGGSATQLWVIDADGGNRRQLTTLGNNLGPAWSGLSP